MESLLLHFLIPFVLLNVINLFLKKKNRIDRSLILILSPLALLPDLDLFVGYHRATLHNLFFGLAIVLAVTYILGRNFQKNHVAIVASFFFLMHLILDGGAVIALFPLTAASYDLGLHYITLPMVSHANIYQFLTPEYLAVNVFGFVLLFLAICFERIYSTQKGI